MGQKWLVPMKDWVNWLVAWGDSRLNFYQILKFCFVLFYFAAIPCWVVPYESKMIVDPHCFISLLLDKAKNLSMCSDMFISLHHSRTRWSQYIPYLTKLVKTKKMGAWIWSYLKSPRIRLHFMTLFQFTLILEKRLNKQNSNSWGDWIAWLSFLENCP